MCGEIIGFQVQLHTFDACRNRRFHAHVVDDVHTMGGVGGVDNVDDKDGMGDAEKR